MTSLPALYAHRLGRDPGPDSSRAALAATLAGPVDGLETDACLTADGRLVLLHDPWLRSATDLGGWAHQTPWRILAGARLLDRHGVATDQTPMRLEELLEHVPGDLPVQIEVKAHGDPALARATRAGVGGVCIEHFLLHRALVDQLRAGGLSVSTGTINDSTLAARAASLGVDAITTDRPAGLRRELDEASLAA